MRRMNKLGVSLGLTAIVSIILALVLGFVVFKYAAHAKDSSEMTDWHQCRLSVLAREQEKKIKGNTEPTTAFDCRTRFTTIDYGSGQFETKKGNQVEYQVDTQEELMNSVARETSGCWWQMGAGEINPFGDFDGDMRCVICSEVTFTDNLVAHFATVGSETNPFDNFLGENNFKYLSYVNENYKDLLQISKRGLSEGEKIGSQPNLLLADSRGKIPYTILYAISSTDRTKEPVGGAAIGAIIGGIICYGAATVITTATWGAAVGTYVICTAAISSSVVIGTGTGVATAALRDENIDRDYFPFWYIGDAAKVQNANCDQLY